MHAESPRLFESIKFQTKPQLFFEQSILVLSLTLKYSLFGLDIFPYKFTYKTHSLHVLKTRLLG